MAQDGVVEFEGVLEFGQRFVVALDVHEHVVSLVHLLDRIGQLTAAPVFQTVDAATATGDERAVALDHRGHLFALVRMDDENHFVMSHVISLRFLPACPAADLAVKPPGMRVR